MRLRTSVLATWHDQQCCGKHSSSSAESSPVNLEASHGGRLSSKVLFGNPCEKPWFRTGASLRKSTCETLRNLAKPCEIINCESLRNTAKPNLRIWAKACEILRNHSCESLRNLSISSKAYLRKLAKIHAFCTRKSLWKHDLRKFNCKTLQKVYLLLAHSGSGPAAEPASSAWSFSTSSHPSSSRSSGPRLKPSADFLSLVCANASLSKYVNKPMKIYKASYTAVWRAWDSVSYVLPPVQNPANLKHRIFASPITRNVRPLSWFEYGFLLSAYSPPFFSCPTAWNQTFLWHWWFLCAAACQASRDIDGLVSAWKFRCPFSPYSVSPRQGNYWETNVCAGKIVLHLKFVIWHSCSTWFRNSQGGIWRDYGPSK